MIFNEDHSEDLINILTYIDEYIGKFSISELQISIKELKTIIMGMRSQFPHVDGLQKASSFKKVANFISCFLECNPIKTQLPVEAVGKNLSECDINAIIALDIALIYLEGSTIHRETGDITISNRIFLSEHAYFDILEALSEDNITPKTHQKILSVFFEQLVYKTNPDCQYQYTAYLEGKSVEKFQYDPVAIDKIDYGSWICEICGSENGQAAECPCGGKSS